MLSENFLKSVRKRESVIGYTDSDWDYDMYDFITYMDSHPEDFKMWDPKKRRLLLTKMEARASTPLFAKNIIENLKSTFPKNVITCHAFCGFTPDSKSFRIHKDVMDVLYLQVIGDIEWSLWESGSEEKSIGPDSANCVYKEKFTPGNWIWVPRGKYHLVNPITPRVGFSFGVERNPDPSTYI